MKIVKIAREKLVEKDIEWKQVYTDKTLFLKEQFEDVVGPGSYFRFEGKDKGSDSEYYCIIGPAKIHDPIAKFFAGVRKLPATYSAGGKYFDSLDTAAAYARDTWGVPTPNSLKPYTSAALKGIKQKVEKWKRLREENEENEDKEASNQLKIEKTASDDYPVTQLPESDLGAKQEQERTIVDNQRNYPSDTTMKEKTDEAIDQMYTAEEQAIIEKYGEDVFEEVKANFEGSEYARETGVGSQMGTLSWDNRATSYNVDKRGPVTVLDLISVTDDITSPNPKIEGLRWDEKTGTYRINIAGKGDRYCTQEALLGYKKLLENVHDKITGDEWEIEERDTHQGDTSSILNDEWAALQGLGGTDSVEDIFSGINDYASDKRKKQVFANVIKNLIRIAKEQDDTGNYTHSEEIHRVIRKYRERIR